jgi:hypothetical protein
VGGLGRPASPGAWLAAWQALSSVAKVSVLTLAPFSLRRASLAPQPERAFLASNRNPSADHDVPIWPASH